MENPATWTVEQRLIASALDPHLPATQQVTNVFNVLRTNARLTFHEGMTSKNIEASLAAEIDAYKARPGPTLASTLYHRMKALGIVG